MDDVEFEHLDRDATRAIFSQIQTVYAAAFPEYSLDGHRDRTFRQLKVPGFETVTARSNGALIGFVYGLPLGEATGWWRGLEPPRAADYTAETGARTFAVIDLAVLPEYRGRGLARRLMDELLQGRTEERATLATSPGKPDIQRMYQRWGWREVGRVPGGEGATQTAFDLYVISLR
ncbi:hypothetical protein GCM10010411_74330 [Actinomadura fulvescens]|uniref:N-acetyltransferase domain-containing protein n=1 Tax=Actinomadura fulvescens TaxID=46160 RepID=A0ABP6CR71_9ACTN